MVHVSWLLFAFAASSVEAAPQSSTQPATNAPLPMYGNWASEKCTDYGATNAALPPSTRWAALGATGAWSEVCHAWNHDQIPKGEVGLTFPEYLMNIFHGPDNWDCQDIGNRACAPGVLQCDSTKAPAGWLIMNSFANLHGIHQEIYEALGTANVQVQAQVGMFAQTFAPVEADHSVEIIKEILDAVAFVAGGLSAYFWNKVAASVLKLWQDGADKGFSKDVFNAAVAYTINANKDALSTSSKALSEQNSLASAVGFYFENWQQAQAAYVKNIFSGSANSLGDLGQMIRDGKMNWPAGSGPDLSDMVQQAKKMLYAQMIPSAWQHGATSRSPIVLESTDPCQSKAGSQMKRYMSDGTAAATHMCMDGRIYYLVNAKTPTADAPGCANLGTCPHHDIFEPLPGGDFNTLSGGAWGNVRIDDIVIASRQGWVNNGNKNGWGTPDFANAIKGGADPFELFANGIQTAGYNTIPFCSVDNLDQIAGRILSNNQVKGPYWPCE